MGKTVPGTAHNKGQDDGQLVTTLVITPPVAMSHCDAQGRDVGVNQVLSPGDTRYLRVQVGEH